MLLATTRLTLEGQPMTLRMRLTRPAFSAETTRVYERRLPGGGVAAIEVTVVRRRWHTRKYWGELVLEPPSSGEGRDGHRPLVVARAMATSAAAVVERLLSIAAYKTAIA